MKPFNLEDLIMECWQVTSDIKLVYEEQLDAPNPMTDDELANVLIGMEYMYQRKFERLFREYEAVCHHGGIFLDKEDVTEIKSKHWDLLSDDFKIEDES